MAHTPSTRVNYQSKWVVFLKWCKKRRVSSSSPSAMDIAHFLLHLREDCDLSTSAIRGYHSALAGVYKFRDLDLSAQPVLREVLKSCALRARPSVRDRRPSWNMDVVLHSLRSAPYEPLRVASLEALTKKTLFLLALATARRVGELQALSARIACQGTDVLLSYLPDFIAKTETEANPLPREFRLRSLAAFVGNEDEERLLCPVRALRCYLQRTASPSRPRQLFTAVQNQSRYMSKNALSFYLRTTIREAHEACLDSVCDLLRVRTHDIRGIATSMLMWRNCSVASILQAACWKTASVFATYYLSDVQREQDDVMSLGPVVAAGSIV